MSKKILTGLLISTLLFQCSNGKQATDDQKNWCYGQYTKFVNLFELVDVGSSSSTFTPKDYAESKGFIDVFMTSWESATDLYNNEYDNKSSEDPDYKKLATEILNSYDKKILKNDTNSFVLVIELRRKALLNEYEGSLEFCKILYDIST